jgi:hypothetical protein
MATASLPVLLFARSFLMMDIVMLAIGLAFFATSIAYAYACDAL